MTHSPDPIPVLQPTVLEYATPAAARARSPLPALLRTVGILIGVVLPLVDFGFSILGYPFGPEWQSGEFHDYVKLLLSARSAWPFFPLLAYSMVCMFLVCAFPRRCASRFVCRLGIYTGIPLAIQFCAIMVLALGDNGNLHWVMFGGLLSVAVPAVALWLVTFCVRRFGWARTLLVSALLLISVIVVGLAAEPTILGAPLVIALVAAPGWALVTYPAVSLALRRIVRDIESERASPALVATWSAAYAASWWGAIDQAIRTYAALPTTRPTHCYVATAAARGHRRLVRSARTPTGALVNDQLRRLKCAEIAVATARPDLHRRLRRAYDRLGPRVAPALACPLLADLAYLSLKPLEWAALHILRRGIPHFATAASRIYSN
jgi:hypothetical protein